MQILDESEQVRDGAEAQRQSPAAYAGREASHTAYIHLDDAGVRALAREAFPALIDLPAGGPPALQADEKIVGYPADNVAQVAFTPGSGRRGRAVIETTAPIALQTSPGHRSPIDLHLSAAGNGFRPALAAVPVAIPKRLADGIGLAGSGVSLTPLGEDREPLAGSEGIVDGTTVLYANTMPAADTVVKPTTFGFSAETLLRSLDSPRTLYFRVGLPVGARLVASSDGSGVAILAEGTELARIAAPTARDAEGTSVPVSMSVSGDMVVVKIDGSLEAYRLPVVVDPAVYDYQWQNETRYGEHYETNWQFKTSAGAKAFTAPSQPEGGKWTETISANHTSTEWGGLFYTTQGESQIVVAHVEGEWNDEKANIRNFALLETKNGPEDYDPLPVATEPGRGWGGYACAPALGCPETIAGSAAPENGNTAAYVQESTASGGLNNGTNTLTAARVEVSQEHGPTLEFNKATATIYNKDTGENVPNVLFGTGEWLGPHHGAFEVKSKDPGLGIQLYRVLGGGFSDWREFDFGYLAHNCYGIQCPEYVNQPYTYRSSLRDGEDSLEAFVEDPVGLYAVIWPQTVKVDGASPSNITVRGFQNGNELPAGETKVKVEATDGEGTTKSSGVKSIKLSVDGQEVAGTSASCAEGPCTASTEATMAARDYTSGEHTLIVTAEDKANNVVQEEFTFRVSGATPMSVGPGAVDPSSGEFTLSASDASLGGVAGVTRTYGSRHLTAGAEGPLGPQWQLSVGGGQSLTVYPEGEAVLTATGGARTTFERNVKGEFESPPGDSNLRLEAKEEHAGKGISYYLLSDATAGTSTKFSQPTGILSKPPSLEEEFGYEAQLKTPTSEAIDATGTVWVTSYGNSLIEKFSPAGALLGTYGSYGTVGGQFVGPWGIAINPANGNVYVSDATNNRIEELNSTGGFIRAFGWGVKDNNQQLEVCEASNECKPGIAGTGAGEFKTPRGVAIDGSGNVWAADCADNRVEEFSATGSFIRQVGSAGSGNGQFSCPTGLTIANGTVYVVDSGNNRVQELNSSGEYVTKFGSAGTGEGQLKSPSGIASETATGDLYVADTSNNRVEEFTSTGGFIDTFGKKGSGEGQFAEGGPLGVAVSSLGVIYATNSGTNLIGAWSRPTWVPTEAGGSGAAATYTYTTVEAEGKSSIQPSEVLAPKPAGVSSCEPLARGCRAFTFNYASTKTASGENEGQWGDYPGRLTRVYLHAWDPAKGEMTSPEVAHYLYDAQGRLRAEWDPRTEQASDCGGTCSALKTTYGYDSEGRVTAVRPPGQQPWALTYGTIAGDPNAGRLVKVFRPKASTTLHSAEVPASTEAPKLTGTPSIGTKLGVTSGKWSGAPVVYGYQWEDCNSEHKACTPIPGAINPNYRVTAADVGHTLGATVTATAGGGSASVTAWTATVETGEDIQTVTQGKNLTAVSCIPGTTDCVATESKGLSYYATNVSTTGSATWKSWTGPNPEGTARAVTCAATTLCLLAYGKEPSAGTLYYATSFGGTWTEAYTPSNGVDAVTCASTTLCVTAQNAGGYFRYATSPASKSWVLESQGTASMNAVACPSTSVCIIGDSKGNVHVATTTAQIESSTWKETNVDGTIAIKGVACSSTTACVAVDASGNALALAIEASGVAKATKQNIAGTNELTAVSCVGASCAAVDAAGVVYTTTNSGTAWTSKKSIGQRLNAVSCASTSLCAAVDKAGDVITFSLVSGSEGESQPAQAGTTIEYNVPRDGSSGLPNLTEAEVAKWGQKDDPVEAAAVLPPDEAQGWPASSYARATMSYWDADGRIVNTATPSGAIATSEYNATNDVIRTLSADNREAALNQGSKSAEVSKLLDTESHYNGETEAEQAHEAEEAAQGKRSAPEPGTELLETRGPQHKVTLAEGGAEVLARNHIHYFYDEGSPEGKHYGLLTKTLDGAEYEGKEADLRTSIRAYAGQGWKLRKPTSTTTDPGGLNLTTQTVYDETTGKVLEATSAGASATNPLPTFSFAFGSWGNGEGQIEYPWGVAVNPKTQNVYVAGYGNGRVEEFSPAGKFIAWIGSNGSGEGQISKPEAIAVDSAGDLWVGDAGNERIDEFNEKGEPLRHFGTKGTGNGQFAGNIEGIAVSGSSVWISDTGNDRIEKFSTTGSYESSFGTEGSGNGQFYGPTGITLSGEKLYVDDYANHRVQQFTTGGEYKLQFGSWGRGNGQLEQPIGIAADPKTGDLYVTDYGSDRVEEFTATGTYVAWLSSYGAGAGQLNDPEAVATSPGGTMYVADRGDTRVEAWAPGYSNARKIRTIYYTSEANPKEPQCGEHREWATLPCRAEPVGQPEDAPNLPISKYTYNIWDEVTSTEETFGTTTRIKAETYDPAGRAITSSTSASVDTPVPAVTNEYSAQTGALIKQSTETKSLKSKFSTTGQLVEYSDAEGNTAKYEYEEGGEEDLLEMSEHKGEELIASQIYSYDPITGFRTKLVDSAASGLTFTVKYDPEGKLIGETYPGGVESKYAYNAASEATGLEYVKTHGSEHTTWLSNSQTPSVHGEALVQTSTLATEHYSYDKAGRLTQTQEEPTGKPCTTRLYGYDEEANRTSLTTREGAEGKCATEGGTIEHHAYDSAARLIDTGIMYETFGNTSKLPASDTGTEHELTNTYYVDNQLETQTQNGETLIYTYDPAGRTLATHQSKPNTTVIDHYGNTSGAVTWTSEGASVWTRNITGLDGALTATQTSTGAITLELHDLNGNIIGTAGTSEAETKLQTSYNSTEFGVPQPGTTPPKYAWQGANGLVSEAALGSGGVVNPGGDSYIPLIGRPLQTLQIASPGAFPDGAAATHVIQANYTGAVGTILKGIAIEEQGAEEEAARKQAEEEAQLNQCPASECGPWPGGGNLSPGAGEEEIDPGLCVGTGSLGQTLEVDGHEMAPYLNFKCKGTGHGVQIELCTQSLGEFGIGPVTRFGCLTYHLGTIRNGAKFGLVADSFQCTVGVSYRIWAWYWEPGMKHGDIGVGKSVACQKDVEETERELVEDTTGPV
jgi:YD repeat-containing protein